MKLYFILVMMLTIFSCGEDVAEVATYEIDGPTVDCPGATVADIDGTYKTCDWQCTNYEGKTDKYVSLTFIRDSESDDWEFHSDYVIESPLC